MFCSSEMWATAVTWEWTILRDKELCNLHCSLGFVRILLSRANPFVQCCKALAIIDPLTLELQIQIPAVHEFCYF
jgi:hypothetical protein